MTEHRFWKTISENLKYLINKKKQDRRIAVIKQNLLNKGFHGRALHELSEIVRESGGYGIGALASRELVHFYMDHPDEVDLGQVERHLQNVISAAITPRRRRKAAIMAAEYYRKLGHKQEARLMLAHLYAKHPHLDLLVGLTNLEETVTAKIDLINDFFGDQGLSSIYLDIAEGEQYFDQIRGKLGNLHPIERNELITVIVSAHNCEDTIVTALRSIQQQSWRNFECIVVDDCSSDGTYEIVNDFIKGDPRFNLIRASVNSGAYVSRNLGLSLARGEFITCHDADDWSHPKKLELQANVLLENKNVYATSSSQVRVSPDLVFNRRGLFGAYIASNFSSLMFRRCVFDRLGYWDSVRFGADSEFLLRFKKVFGNTGLVALPQVLSFQRYSASSLTGNRRFGFNGYFFGARLFYRGFQERFHRSGASLKFPFPMKKRPFAVPNLMLPHRAMNGSGRHFDVIVASDFSLDCSSDHSAIRDIISQSGTGTRIGILQIWEYNSKSIDGLSAIVTDLLDEGAAELIVYGENVTCDLMVVDYPPILQERQQFVPEVKAKQIKVLMKLLPMSDYGPKGVVRYSIPQCVENLRYYFGKDATWYPIGPSVNEALNKHHSDWLNSAEFSNANWQSTIDLRD